MAIVRKEYKRSLTIVVRGYSGSTLVFTHTYNGLSGFTWNNTYPTITSGDLATLSDSDYNARLSDFKELVKTLEPNVNFLTPISGDTVYDVSCAPDPPSYSGSFFDFLCESDVVDETCDYKFSILGLYKSDKGLDSSNFVKISEYNNLETNNILKYNIVYAIILSVEAKLDNAKPAPVFEVIFAPADSVIQNTLKYDYSLFNTKIVSGYGNDEIVDDFSYNFYGISGQYIKSKIGIASYKPETLLNYSFTGKTITSTYMIKFTPYVLGNIDTSKQFRAMISPTNSIGNYSYCYNSDDYIDFTMKYYKDEIFCNIFPTTFVRDGLTHYAIGVIKISNNGNAVKAKIRSITGSLIANIDITPYSNYIEIPLTGYNLASGTYNIELVRADNTTLKKTQFIVI
jgi:hypothetical protein